MIPFVVDGPRFLSKSTEYERCIDEKASVVCTAVGNPLPEVLLYKNGILLKRNVTNVRHQLTINSASDFGAYICISNNSVGRVSVTTIINEKRKLTDIEYIEVSLVMYHCTATMNFISLLPLQWL